MKNPCEKVIWYVLPAIRRELVRSIVKDFGFKQRETARMLGISDAAVSQYLSKKRGKVLIKDKVVLSEVTASAKSIIQDKERVDEEICRLCSVVRNSDAMQEALRKVK